MKNAKKYRFWLYDSPIDNPIVISVCPKHYDELSFAADIEAQDILEDNVICIECEAENYLDRI